MGIRRASKLFIAVMSVGGLIACEQSHNGQQLKPAGQNASYGLSLESAPADASTLTARIISEGPVPRDLRAMGGDISGGGSGPEAEFKAVAENLAQRFEAAGFYFDITSSHDTPSVWLDEYKDVIKRATVVFEQRPLHRVINGQVKNVEALNFPELLMIKVNTASWLALTDIKLKEALVLHEYFSILKVERDTYEISTGSLALLRKKETPLDPKDECPQAALGLHNGSYCLWAITEMVQAEIKSIEDALLEFATVKGSNDTLLDIKNEIRGAVLQLRETYLPTMDLECKLHTAALGPGNLAAYEGSVCEVNFTKKRLDFIRSFYNSLRPQYPDLKPPAPIAMEAG